MEYATDLFDAPTIEQMVSHYTRLLESVTADANRRVSDLPMLSDAERLQLVEGWNGNVVHFPDSNLLVHELFERQAATTPDAVAVLLGREQLTYATLETRANRLAHHLKQRGVGPDVLVALWLERSLELVVSMLAVLKAGGAFVPLDLGYPRERLAWLLEGAQPRVLLTQSSLANGIPKSCAEFVLVDQEWALIEACPSDQPQRAATSENLAYVIYTSGSTGRPKGVMIPHRAITNHMLWMQSVFPITAQDAVLQKTPCGFDAAIWEFFAPWTVGARLVLARQDGHRDPAYLVSEIVQQRITTLQVVPTLLSLLLDEPEFRRCSTLRRVFSGGEALTPELQDRFFTTIDAELHNLYGPTETCIDSVVWSCERSERRARVPIGRPIANMRCYIVDRRNHLVPIGAAGELLIGGVGLSRGYWRSADLTAARFCCDPFRAGDDNRTYKTGDLARYLRDGNIEYLGRLDHQVKMHGYRVELEEIAAALKAHAALSDAMVTTADGGRTAQLVAYVCPRNGLSLQISELRRHLEERLPSYMIPAVFVVLDRLPLTPNGKVDRAALPAPESTRPELEAAYVSPTTAAEATLARIWSEVLGLEQVGVRDNYFELGGDSILSIQIVTRAKNAGLRLTPQMLFQHQTIAELALAAEGSCGPAIVAEDGVLSGPVPLLPIEHWWLEALPVDASHFNQAVLFAAPGIEPVLLARSLAELLRQHDALRLRVCPHDGGWHQEYIPWREEARVPLTVVDLTGVSTPEAEIERHTAAWQTSLDLSQGQLLAGGLFERGANQTPLMFLAAHHIAVDGVTWRILLEDLETIYEQLRCGQAVRLPAKTSSLRQWVEGLAQWAAGEEAHAAARHWLTLADISWTPLPQEGSGENLEGMVDAIEVRLTAEETTALLQRVPAAYRTQIQEVLVTAVACALAEWSASGRVWLNLEGHGREALIATLDVSRTAGWFTSLYPVVVDIDAELGPGGQLQCVKEQLRAVPQRGLSYGVLRYLSSDADLRAAMRRVPTPEVSFNYLGQLGREAGARFRTGAARSAQQTRRHLLEINGSVYGGVLEITWTYSTTRHRRETIERIARMFLERLRELIAHCLSPDAGGYTPSDFAHARIDKQELDKLLGKLKARG